MQISNKRATMKSRKRKSSKKKKNYLLGFLIVVIICLLIYIAYLYFHNAERFPSIFPGRAAKEGDTIGINYVAMYKDGRIYDTNIAEIARRNNISKPSFPVLEIEIGQKGLIKGLNEGLIGMKAGEKKSIVVLPKDGYGLYKAELVETFSMQEFRQSFPMVNDITRGKRYSYTLQDGQRGIFTIKDFGQDYVVIDLNHNLAGKTLIFEVEMVYIEDHYKDTNLDDDNIEGE